MTIELQGLGAPASPLKSRSRLEAENAALRHQLIILCRQRHVRVRLSNNDRWFFIQLYGWFPSIRGLFKSLRDLGPDFLFSSCVVFTTVEKNSQRNRISALPVGNSLCRNISLDLSSRDGGSGPRFSGFECGPDFLLRNRWPRPLWGLGGFGIRSGPALFLGDRERPDYSTLAEGLSAQPTRIPRRRPILN